jgi:hypothetical protein
VSSGPANQIQPEHGRRPNIITTANFHVLEKPLQPDQGLKVQQRVATEQPSFAPPKVEAEPEARLWKVCAETASRRYGALEWITFLLLGVLALGAAGFCFAELFQLINSGAPDQTVRALLTK